MKNIINQTNNINTKCAKTTAASKSLKSNSKFLNSLIIASLLTLPVISAVHASDLTVIEQPISQEELHKQAQLNEGIGLGSGIIIGAVVAGPIGAIVAGIAGGYIANHINTKNDVEVLEDRLSFNKSEHQQALIANQKTFEQKLQTSEQAFQTELLALEQSDTNANQIQADNLLMSLQFSTGSSEIKPHYQEQVAALADLLNQNSQLSIDLSGYTDLAGDKSVNEVLSEKRVRSVKALLMAQGVDEERINTFSYGEDSPIMANADHERNFYDRRVVMKLHKNVSRTAKN